jgi:choline dehydrogenase/5-(hydroxymethyl)furfural/furfural oxidase
VNRWLVVGGGSAGCVVAARLGELGAGEVTLLEAGADHGSLAAAPGEPVVDRAAIVRDGVTVVRRPGAEPVPYLQGSGLGGSALVNGAVVVGDPVAEAHGHRLPIEPADDLGPVATAVIAARGADARVGLVRRDGRRVTVLDTYLRPAMARGDLVVRCDTTVARIVFDGRRAVGVTTSTGEHVPADRVVVCAGAIETPALLLRSGVDTPGVGDGIQDHAGVAISFDLPDGPRGGVAIGAIVAGPHRQIVVMDRLPGRADMGALIAGHLSVRSTGRVSLPDPDGPPLVELRQLTVPADVDGLMDAVREAVALLDEPNLRAVVGDRYIDDHGTSPDAIVNDEAALRAWLPDHLGGFHHVAASCRTGTVLDGDGSVRGYDGLFVCDASALPAVPVRNLYLTVVRRAERLATQWAAA